MALAAGYALLDRKIRETTTAFELGIVRGVGAVVA